MRLSGLFFCVPELFPPQPLLDLTRCSREENRPVHPHLRQGHFRENHPQDRPVGRIIPYGKIPLNRILLPIPGYNNPCTNSV